MSEEGRSRAAALAVAQFLSIAGDRVHYLALVALLTAPVAGAARDSAQTAGGLFWLGAAMVLPPLLLSPFAGPLVDRWPLVRTLVVTDALRAAVVLALPLLYVIGGAAALLAGVFAGFALNVFFLPARSAIPALLVPPERRLSLNALLALCAVLATLLGSALGGTLVDRIGWRRALVLDAATFAVSAVLLLGLRGVERPRRRRALRARVYGRQVVGGLALLVRRPRARRAALATAALWVGGGFLHVAGAVHAQGDAGSTGRLGALMATFGAGMAVSALWILRRPAVDPARGMALGLFGAALGLLGFAAARWVALFFAAALWVGLCVGPVVAAIDTELQAVGGERRRGRLFAARDVAARLAFLAAIALAGVAVAALSPRAALAIGALILIAIAAACWPGRARTPLPHPAGRSSTIADASATPPASDRTSSSPP